MAGIISGVQQSADLILSMLAEHSDELLDKCRQCIAGFLARLDVHDRDDVLAKLLAHLNSDEDACIRLLRCAPFDSATWQLFDRHSDALKQRCWREVDPHWGRHDEPATATFVDELLNAGRPRAVFQAAHMDWQFLDSPRWCAC